jgi:hypothetical protein
MSLLTTQLTMNDGNGDDKEDLIRNRDDLLKAQEEVGRHRKELDKAQKKIK